MQDSLSRGSTYQTHEQPSAAPPKGTGSLTTCFTAPVAVPTSSFPRVVRRKRVSPRTPGVHLSPVEAMPLAHASSFSGAKSGLRPLARRGRETHRRQHTYDATGQRARTNPMWVNACKNRDGHVDVGGDSWAIEACCFSSDRVAVYFFLHSFVASSSGHLSPAGLRRIFIDLN
jgi:hypothetical protein